MISEKTYALMADGRYTFRVDDRAHKTQIRAAVEEIFDVTVVEVRTSRVRSKPKRRGVHAGRTRAWKKAIVSSRPASGSSSSRARRRSSAGAEPRDRDGNSQDKAHQPGSPLRDLPGPRRGHRRRDPTRS